MSRQPCSSGKRGAYPDWDTAIAAALRCSRKLGPLRCYECPECGRWHLTRLARWVER